MPFVPALSFAMTWRHTPSGEYLLAVTITDEEDGRETVIYEPCPPLADLIPSTFERAFGRWYEDHWL